jgi:hypothetical protein
MTKNNLSQDISSIEIGTQTSNSSISPSILNAARAAREFGALVSPATLNAARAAREFGALVSPATLNAARAASEFGALVSPATLNAARAAREFGALVSPATLNAARNLIRQTDLLNNLQLSESLVEALSEIDINELQLFLEDEEVQEAINEELSVVEQENDQLSIMQQLNNWAVKVLDFPTSLREKSAFIYLILTRIMMLVSLTIIPGIQDVIKETVWHVSDFIEEKKEKESKEKPKAQVKELKATVLLDYPDAERAMNYVRITNRETPVYRSQKRKSGKIDTIKSNKPVIIVHKKQNWSLVIYRNSFNEEVNGWVFTKNLTK